VPRALLPILARIAAEMPLPYRDGCHWAAPLSSRCVYGNAHARTTIVLFGDSHALNWFPAVYRVAKARGWRLINVTRSACVPAHILSYDKRSRSIMRSCLTWRERAVQKIGRLRPTIVLVSGTRGFAVVDSAGRLLSGEAKTDAWIRGMKWTLARLVPSARRVILLADTPSTLFSSPATCLRRHAGHSIRCATSVAHAISYPWLNTELRVASAMHAGFINPELWVCPTSPCPEVVWGRLVHRNRGHLTVSFTSTQWRRMERAILRELSRQPTARSP
jgi:hypothetical protein